MECPEWGEAGTRPASFDCKGPRDASTSGDEETRPSYGSEYSQSAPNSTLEHALELAARGLPVFPCRRRDKRPTTDNGFYDATCEPDQVRKLWRERPGDAIGVRTGEASGIAVLDLDTAKHPEAINWLDENAGRLPTTREHQTPSGGRHLLFQHRSGLKSSAGQIALGVDARADGGYAIWWEAAGFPVTNAELIDILPPWPDWLVPEQRSPANGSAPPPLPNADERIRKYCRAAYEDELRKVGSAPKGRRNAAVNEAAFAVGSLHHYGHLSEAEVRAGLQAACGRNGLIAEDGETAFQKTYASGWNAGLASPRTIPDQEQHRASSGPRQDHASDSEPQAGPAPERLWPTPLEDAAFHGLAGEIVRAIRPHTEADDAALLLQLLAAFGCAVGRESHFMAEADRHGANLFVAIVAPSSKGRKGTSWGQARRPVVMADEGFAKRIVSGLSTGEGLIHHVRDPVTKTEQETDKYDRPVGNKTVVVDEGITDKRLLVFEGEFGATLQVLMRQGNILSAIVRLAWDNRDLQTLSKTTAARATGAHIAIVAHVTQDELLRELDDNQAANGFANRFLWACARRSKLLPEGGSLRFESLIPLVDGLKQAREFAFKAGEVHRDNDARELWGRIYPSLTADGEGLFGSVTARAEAQVMRLALIYALLDCSSLIRKVHLEAALAVWRYCADSAFYIFGGRSGNSIADRIASALAGRPDGMTRQAIGDLFAQHCRKEKIDVALELLERLRKACKEEVKTRGRPKTIWRRR